MLFYCKHLTDSSKIFIRLNVQQTLFGQTAEFSLKTFRFTSGGSVATEQTQTVECTLHLEQIANISETQAEDCACYTKEECESKKFALTKFSILWLTRKHSTKIQLKNQYLGNGQNGHLARWHVATESVQETENAQPVAHILMAIIRITVWLMKEGAMPMRQLVVSYFNFKKKSQQWFLSDSLILLRQFS